MDNNQQVNYKWQKIVSFLALLLFFVLSLWYFYLHFLSIKIDESTNLKIWASSYQIIAAFGGIVGLFVSSMWGGHKSLVGRSLLYFSLGLLLQVFGQSVDSYYNIFQNQAIPYPSFGDIGFMGSVFAYIAGAYTIMKSVGLKFSIRSIKGKVIGIFVPVVILTISYFFFLKGYQFDWTNPLKVLLDFGYPFGQALYLALALVAFLISQNYLGGIMRKPILFLLSALVFQYASDFMFLYQANAGTWYAGGINDYMYCISYLLMTLSLISTAHVFVTIKKSDVALSK